MEQRILIAEDDLSVGRFLVQALSEAGYQPVLTTDGNEALSQADSIAYAAILLDVVLPGMDGFEVCRNLRTAGNAVPVLMITARDTLDDRIRGLDMGADDYIVKPFEVAELLARLRAILRRGRLLDDRIEVGGLTLNSAARRVTRNDVEIPLSVTEYNLLEYLIENSGRVLTRPMILNHVWQYDFAGNDNVLDVYISYIRAKIDKDSANPLIHTVRGVGFMLEDRNGA